MPQKSTMTHKNLLHTDPVVSFWGRAQGYIQENARRLGAIALVVCVIVAGAAFWMVRQSRVEEESLSSFLGAMALMSREVKAGAEQDLQYNQALEGFKSVSRQFSGTRAGSAALLYAGSCAFKLKQYDQAITYFNEFLEAAGSSLGYLKPFALENLGYAYEEKGEYDQALQWFEKQDSGRDQTMFNPSAPLNLARCYEAKGETERACELYRTFVQKNPASAFKELAEAKAAVLCVQAVAPVP